MASRKRKPTHFVVNNDATLDSLFGSPVLPWETDLATIDAIRADPTNPINLKAKFQDRILYAPKIRTGRGIPQISKVIPPSKTILPKPPSPKPAPKPIVPNPIVPKTAPKPPSPKPIVPKLAPKPPSPKPIVPKLAPKPIVPKLAPNPIVTKPGVPKPIVPIVVTKTGLTPKVPIVVTKPKVPIVVPKPIVTSKVPIVVPKTGVTPKVPIVVPKPIVTSKVPIVVTKTGVPSKSPPREAVRKPNINALKPITRVEQKVPEVIYGEKHGKFRSKIATPLKPHIPNIDDDQEVTSSVKYTADVKKISLPQFNTTVVEPIIDDEIIIETDQSSNIQAKINDNIRDILLSINVDKLNKGRTKRGESYSRPELTAFVSKLGLPTSEKKKEALIADIMNMREQMGLS